MPLIAAKCTNCGALLKVDSAKDAAVCEYCGTPFIIEKAVNNYNTTNNISGSVVNIYGGNSAEFVIRAGVLEKYNGASTEAVIPDTVKIIGDSAFRGCKCLTSVKMPNSLTSIGKDAFSDCTNLTIITIPNSVTFVGDNAFRKCTSLTNIIIPDSVTSIGSASFALCFSLISVTIGNSVTSLNKHVFTNCFRLSSITIPDSVTSIGEKAFNCCSSLANITVGDGVTSIGDSAFKYCSSLTKLTIPNSVTSIGKHAFEGCSSLTDLVMPKSAKSTGKKSGCYIATAVYGSYDCPQVWTLRRFRDDTLARSWYGRLFIIFYYAVSPHIVKKFGETMWFYRLFRKRLDRLVARLNGEGVADTPYKD